MFSGFNASTERIRSIRTKKVYVSASSNDKADYLKICTSPKYGGILPSDLTMWPLEEYLRYQAPFFSFFHTLDAAKEGSVLEVGSGSGRALLDLKAEYPSIKAYGTNRKGYGFAQGSATRVRGGFLDRSESLQYPCVL